MSEAERAGRRGRGAGGGAARRAERSAPRIEAAPFIRRRIPDFEILDEEGLAQIEANAETVLEEIGVRFADNPEALRLWREAGAEVRDGDRVHMPKGLARSLCATAPREYVQHARNPARSVTVGGRNLVLAPVYGPPFVRDLEGGRRYATMEDFRNFVKLGFMSKWLHHSGGTVCEPTDIAVNKRHLDMLLAHMTLSDKPFMGAVTAPERAEDAVAMCRILFGDRVGPECFMTSLINVNSPLVFDATMVGALEVYARAGQASIVSPFIVRGAMAPVSVAGTLTQVLAEATAGIAYAQLVNPGCPVIFGAFVTSIDMNSGAPTFGTPEASKILWGAGQLARRLNLPFRSGGALCGSKLPDAQAAYESANTLQAALLGGVNFMLHACGWLEGGLVSGYETFVLDADQLGVLHSLAEGVDLSENGQALDALREVGPGGHFLGCAHTQANFKDAFWRTQVLDYRPFETWAEAGAPDSAQLANARVRRMLAEYEAPAIDPGVAEALGDYVARRKASEADAFG